MFWALIEAMGLFCRDLKGSYVWRRPLDISSAPYTLSSKYCSLPGCDPHTCSPIIEISISLPQSAQVMVGSTLAYIGRAIVTDMDQSMRLMDGCGRLS